MTTEKTTQYLKYQFSPEEMAGMSQEMAEAISQKQEAELRLKEVSTAIKAEIAKHDGIISDRAGKYRQGYEYRNIPCTIERDFDNGTYRVTRNDTGEVVTDRLLREDELQLAMTHGE